MMHAVISGDVVAFTSLSVEQRTFLDERIEALLRELAERYGVSGRVVRGDYLELYVPQPEQSLRVLLLVKTFVRAQEVPAEEGEDKRVKLFRDYGIRLALGMGELERLDPEKGVLDGEAVYLSGRLINEEKTHDKKRVTVKRTLFFRSADAALEGEVVPLLALIDELLFRATGKQCEALYHRLLGKEEKQIAEELGRSQSTVNQHTNQAGWPAIELAVARFESIVAKKL